MHDTALIAGEGFIDTYITEGMHVVDIGGQNVNGSLKDFFIKRGIKYTCVDLEPHWSVDIVVKPGDKLPFETGTIDAVVSTSCFEHDPCFWMTFKEMCRIVKLGGYIYVNAPSNGPYHTYPGDNWRFYQDAGQALAYWSGVQIASEEIHPVSVEETFFVNPITGLYTDFLCIWKRVLDKEVNIVLPDAIKNKNGKLKNYLTNK